MYSLNHDNLDETQSEKTEKNEDIIGFDKSDSDFNLHSSDTADDYCE